jgi:hypothetical protein
METMTGNTGQQYDRHLVRRFIHLMGVYPPATLVRLTDGSVGIVVDADGGERPVVKALFAGDGARLQVPRLMRIDRADGPSDRDSAVGIEAALDPSQYDLDPADYL